MRHALYAIVLLLLVTSATSVHGDGYPPPPQTLPPVSYTEATMPTSLLGPETDLDCLTAAEGGSTVTASLVCYDWTGPALH